MSKKTLMRLLAVVFFASVGRTATAVDVATPEQIEFFELRVRPILVEQCLECHGRTDHVESGLYLTSREALLTGGSRGPAVELEDLGKSLLLRAVLDGMDSELHMPPEKTLSKEEVGALQQWIEMGVPWPKASELPPLDSRVTHWAFQPIETPAPPIVDDTTWPRTPVDRFVLARLEKAGLRPTNAADRQTLLRRMTFDVTGLPPSRAQIEQFVNDPRPDAVDRLIDRLLASPHFGERWGRHWLDVVAFAETNGQEVDDNKPYAYRYRDYVIKAMNSDLAYDRFIKEQLAGDLIAPDAQRPDILPPPEVATAIYWLGEFQPRPAKPENAKAVEIESQIDLISKSFLGLTLACARCHEHKFDPIPTSDYYALAGILRSSHNKLIEIDSPHRQEKTELTCQQLAEIDRRIDILTRSANVSARLNAAHRLSEYLHAAGSLSLLDSAEAAKKLSPMATQHDLAEPVLQRWYEAIVRTQESGDRFLVPWVRMMARGDGGFVPRANRLHRKLTSAQQESRTSLNGVLFDDFENTTYDPQRWEPPVGAAFGNGPTMSAIDGWRGFQGSRFAASDRVSGKLTGRLTSRPFVFTHRYMSVRIAGRDDSNRTYINVKYHSPVIIEFPEYRLTGKNSHQFVRETLDLQPFLGREGIIEIVDDASDENGYIAVDEIVFSDELPPPQQNTVNPVVANLLIHPHVSSVSTLATEYENKVVDILSRYQNYLDSPAANESEDHTSWNGASSAELDILGWLLSFDSPLSKTTLESHLSMSELRRLKDLRVQRNQCEKDIAPSAMAIATFDRRVSDTWIQVRGNATRRGTMVPRGHPRFLSETTPSPVTGSGRLELANWIASKDNPLMARVIVNRLWQHYFGTGIVSSSNNFGYQGESPSHPELLDFLATRLVETHFSLKAIHRLLLQSSTYQQSSTPEAKAVNDDPDNRLLSHMSVRRLEAECIRDALLQVSGSLDLEMHGPSVPLYVSRYMTQGPDLPTTSGPLDGDRRRTVYLEVRRNRHSELLDAFNFPSVSSSVGRRPSSLLPTQALALLNDEFVAIEAHRWAQRIMLSGGDDQEKLTRMYQMAFGRNAKPDEIATALEFLKRQRNRFADAEKDNHTELESWASLGHVLWNLAEFIYVF